MKKFGKLLAFLLVVVLLMGVLPATSLAAPLTYYPSSDDPAYFCWGASGDGKEHGVLLLNDGGTPRTELTLYYEVDPNTGIGEFFLNPECTIRCVALGVDKIPYGRTEYQQMAISWVGMGHSSSNYGNAVVTEGDRATSRSALDVSELLIKFKQAYDELYIDMSSRPLMAPMQNISLNIVMKSTYNMSWTEFNYHDYSGAVAGVHTVGWQPNTGAFAFTQSDINTLIKSPEQRIIRQDNGISYFPDQPWYQMHPDRFNGQVNIIRDDDLRGPMISMVGTLGAGEQRIHFAPGVNVTFDNNTTYDSDVAVYVGTNCLFQFEDAHIINSKSDSTNNYGIGIQLDGSSSNVELNGAVELGADIGGSCQIHDQHIGIEMTSGVTRFKAPRTGDPFSVTGNDVALNMHHGTYIAKWTHDISAINSKDVLITISEPDLWQEGDVIFSSGQTRVNAAGIPIGTAEDSPLLQSDLSAVEFAYAGNLFNVFSLEFISRGAGDDYTFPKFVIAGAGSVFNTRTQRWYQNLNNALHDDTVCYDPSDGTTVIPTIADGDTLVYYKDVMEPRGVTVDYDITIRSAYQGETSPDPLHYTSNEAGHTASWYNTNDVGSFIIVAPDKTVTLGGSDSGIFTIDCNSVGRAVYINEDGTLNLEDNVVVTEGKTTVDGSAIYQDGTLNVGGDFELNGFEVYLPAGKVITKADTFTDDINVYLGDTDKDIKKGRDILVSGTASVATTDNALIIWDNPKDGYSKVYSADGYDGTNPGVDDHVIELDAHVFYIVHSSDPTGEPEEVAITSTILDSGFDITTRTYEEGTTGNNYLYGGMATDGTFDTAYGNALGENDCGVGFDPVENQTYYLREVSNDYLLPRIMSVKRERNTPHDEIEHFLLTAIDGDGVSKDYYTGYGFILNRADGHCYASMMEGNAQTPTTSTDVDVSQCALYETIAVYDNGELTTTYTPRNVFGSGSNVTNDDYFGAIPLEGHSSYTSIVAGNYVTRTGNAISTFSYSPYYVTADGVVVISSVQRSVDNTDTTKTATTNTDSNVGSKTIPAVAYEYEAIRPEPMVVMSAFSTAPRGIPVIADEPINDEPVNDEPQETPAIAPAASKPVITIIANNVTSKVTVETGNHVGTLEAPKFAGLRFAGWFADKKYAVPADLSNVQGNMTVYGKYVKDSYFSVAVIKTVSLFGKSNIRVISVEDDTPYKEVGMKISINGVETTYKMQKAFASLSGMKANKIFGSGILKTAKMYYQDVKTDKLPFGTKITVTPYYITPDGTMQLGTTRVVY